MMVSRQAGLGWQDARHSSDGVDFDCVRKEGSKVCTDDWYDVATDACFVLRVCDIDERLSEDVASAADLAKTQKPSCNV